MATTKLASEFFRKPVHILFCLLVVCLSLCCAAWGWTVLPIFFEQYRVEGLAPRVIGGQVFPSKLLESVVPLVPFTADVCRASALKATVIVQLRLLEAATALPDRELVESIQKKLRISVREALSCSPTESFLWLLHYWLQVSQNGFDKKMLQYLRMSYALGANEGWISIKRNGLSLAIYDRLPEDMTTQVVAEFVSLVRSDFMSEAVANLSGPGWPKREVLIAALAHVDERRRYQFSKSLRAEGIYLDIPGVIPAPRRPWN